VFFYHDGVNNSTRLTEPPQDDRHIVNRWAKLAEEHGVDLVVCVAAALRRGIKDENLAPGFRISGLGQLIESASRPTARDLRRLSNERRTDQEIHVREPQGAARHGLRAGVAGGGADHRRLRPGRVSLAFMDDGVYQLKKGRTPRESR
jgi:sulfur relay (sulfurtransferase) complex TusBCD TusD component (DsrE family)